ncbi:hypothetical protein [Listeria costaricensis]|uniref:hypothetical protein n=1 Tax=Listeria costaricensis TaxID=2026604 RepID=UPI000C073247|nr:hypothetical protein [Listeria costaricensis]
MKIEGIMEAEQLNQESKLASTPEEQSELTRKMTKEPNRLPPVSFSINDLTEMKLAGENQEIALRIKLMISNATKAGKLIDYLMKAGVKYATDSAKWQQITQEISGQISTILMKQRSFNGYFTTDAFEKSLLAANNKITDELSFLLTNIRSLKFDVTGKVPYYNMLRLAARSTESAIAEMKQYENENVPLEVSKLLAKAKDETSWLIKLMREYSILFHSRHLLTYELQAENINLWKLGNEYLKTMNEWLPIFAKHPHEKMGELSRASAGPLADFLQELETMATGHLSQGNMAVMMDRVQGQLQRLFVYFQKMEQHIGTGIVSSDLGATEAELASDMTKMMMISSQEMSFFDLLWKDFRTAYKDPSVRIISLVFLMFIFVLLLKIFF